MKNINEYPYLEKAIMLPNYDIISIFKLNNNNNLITLKGNFKDFIENQVKNNAPGKSLKDISNWIEGKVDYGCIEWKNGVSLGEDYIYDNSQIISNLNQDLPLIEGTEDQKEKSIID